MIDRFYFKSIYFREPNGVLFELATLGPGFAADEDPEHLGERLSLPPDFEHLRERIEPVLTPLPNPRGVSPAVVRERAGRPASRQGALVLLHGRGADEHDLYPLLDALDPERQAARRDAARRRSRCRRAARTGTGSRGIPTPDPDTFWPSFELLSGWLDGLQRPLVLGGFSQGAVMSWALGLGRGPAKRPAAIVALSGFMPEVDGLELDLSGLDGYPVAIGHGAYDDIIPVEFGREATGAPRGRRRRRPLPRVPAAAHDRPRLPPRAAGVRRPRRRPK